MLGRRQASSSFMNVLVCLPQRIQQPSTSAPCRRRQPFTWRHAGDTWTASNPCSRLGLNLTSPTSLERHHSTKVSPTPHPPAGFPEEGSRN